MFLRHALCGRAQSVCLLTIGFGSHQFLDGSFESLMYSGSTEYRMVDISESTDRKGGGFFLVDEKSVFCTRSTSTLSEVWSSRGEAL